MSRDITVKESKVHGKGVFAAKDFRKDDVVLEWHPTILTKSRAHSLLARDRHYLYKVGRKYLFMQPPERYVNHSCEPNTQPKDYSDVAIKDIARGEEITSDYGEGNPVGFKCRCGSKNCRGFIGEEKTQKQDLS